MFVLCVRREREKLLHILEVVPGTEKQPRPKADRDRVVKAYSRSAAGKELHNSVNLRPPEVLLKTVKYLLSTVIVNDKVPWNVTYDYIMDRLRSVRQDMVIGDIPAIPSILILQPIVRFYAYSAYRLCDQPISYFDPHINKTHLQECLKRLLCIYDECYREATDKSGNNVLSYLEVTRPQIEAMYIILNMDSTIALNRALTLPKKWRNALIHLCSKLSLSYLRQNYVRTCRLIKKLPLLLQCVAALHLPSIRMRALQMMSVAYNSKNLTVPIEYLKELYLYNTAHVVKTDCLYYGLKISGNSVQFIKTDFDQTKAATQPTHLDFIDKGLKANEKSSLILDPDVEWLLFDKIDTRKLPPCTND